jgi:hypothetical protein
MTNDQIPMGTENPLVIVNWSLGFRRRGVAEPSK